MPLLYIVCYRVWMKFLEETFEETFECKTDVNVSIRGTITKEVMVITIENYEMM